MKQPSRRGNLFASGDRASGEEFLTLLETAGARISRIVSRSHSSPPGFWYDQDEDEWVVLVRGTAALEFDGGEIVEMKEGDFLLIERHERHRVARTSEHAIWLAAHLK
jgi:cupin 2 domain-containing protein